MNTKNRISRGEYEVLKQEDLETPLLVEESFCFTDDSKTEKMDPAVV